MNLDIKKTIDSLTNKDKKNNLEVEHLLKLLHLNNKDLIHPLITLKRKHNWRQINNEFIIPFGTWTDIICEYLENGYSRMTDIANSKNVLFPFAISVLEELKTKESFDSLCEILANFDINKEDDLPFILRTISTINFVTAFRDSPEIRLSNAKFATDYITRTISKLIASEDTQEHDLATCILSLRGIANTDTIEFIRKLPPFKKIEYVDINNLTINSIKKKAKINTIT